VLRGELYKSLLRNIEAEFEARQRDLESERRKAIEALNEAWPKMGGSEQDLIPVGVAATVSSPVEEREGDQWQEAGEAAPTRNGASPGRTIHMSVIREEVLKALSESDSDIVTQPELKERIMDKYPDADVARVASAISRCLTQLTKRGDLELVEKGRARAPHKYRKTKREEVGHL
jgi:hypothetical protein